MGHLIAYLRKMIENNAALKADFFNNQEIVPSEKQYGQHLNRIFQPSLREPKLALSIGAQFLFHQLALDLEKKLENFSSVVDEQSLAQVDEIINSLEKVLHEDPEWKKLFAEIPNRANRQAFVRDVTVGFIFKVVSVFAARNPHLVPQAEFFRLAIGSRGQPTEERLQQLSKKIKTPPEEPEEKMVQPIIYYFPGQLGKGKGIQKINKFHGHIALEVPREKSSQPRYYLSYGTASGLNLGLVGDDPQIIQLDSEEKIYGEAIPIVLPPRPLKDILAAKKEFEALDRNDYQLLTKNCAIAVSNFMKKAKYINENESFTEFWPSSIAALALKATLQDINASRQKILVDRKIDPLKKISLLLENDVRRLEATIKLDNITNKKFFKRKNKPKKIAQLANLKAIIDDPNQDYSKKAAALVAAHALSTDKTKKNLADCIHCFPFARLPFGEIDRKREFLLALELAVTQFLEKESPLSRYARKSLLSIKGLFPNKHGENSELLAKDPESIFLLFDKLFKILSKENGALAFFKNEELVDLYKSWYAQAVKANEATNPSPSLSEAVEATKAVAEKEEEKNSDPSIVISLSQTSSFLEHPESHYASLSAPVTLGQPTKPDQWYSFGDSPDSRYRYIKKQDGEIKPAVLKEMLLDHLAEDPEEQAHTILTCPPKLEKGEKRLSTHVLPEPENHLGLKKQPVKFGLLEKCIKPGQEIDSTLILPTQQPTSAQLLRIIDRQMQESVKLLGKKGNVKPCITIPTLDLDHDFKSKRPLKLIEKAFLQYCLAMNVNCSVTQAGRIIVLNKEQLKALVPRTRPARLQQKILAARTQASAAAEEKETPHSINKTNSFSA